MTLRQKTLIIIVALTAVAFVAEMQVMRAIVLRAFAAHETNHAREEIRSAYNVLMYELDTLDALAYDWASWNDTYAFAQDHNADYIASNLVAGTMPTLSIHVFMILDINGQVVYAEANRLPDGGPTALPDGLLAHFAPGRPLLFGPDAMEGTRGLLALPQATLLFSARPVLSSEDEGPAHGTLVMGRLLDDALLRRLSMLVQTPVQVHRLDAASLPAEIDRAAQALSPEAKTLVRAVDRNQIAAYRLLDDVYGDAAFILATHLPRTVYTEAEASVRYTLLSLLAGSLLFSIAAFTFLERLVIAPLARLSQAVRQVGAEADASARVVGHGTIEIVHLSESINAMLARLNETQQQLQDALQAKDEMIQNVSHELRTPLTQIIGYTDLMLDGALGGGALSAEHRTALQTVREQAHQVSTLVDMLLMLQSLAPGAMQKQAIQMEALLARTLALWQARAETQGIALTSEAPAHLPPVCGDARFLEQAVGQLLDNALKFTDAGGTVMVRLEHDADHVCLSVADSGIGIPPDKLDKIFDRFYQVDGSSTRRYRGTGIGLSLVREVVLLHGGRVWATSNDAQQGVTLHMALPVAS